MRELGDDVVSHGSFLWDFCAAAAVLFTDGLLCLAFALGFGSPKRESQSQSPKPAFGKRSKAFQS
jgi:hypothetical protein